MSHDVIADSMVHRSASDTSARDGTSADEPSVPSAPPKPTLANAGRNRSIRSPAADLGSGKKRTPIPSTASLNGNHPLINALKATLPSACCTALRTFSPNWSLSHSDVSISR